jgi:6,7-dimethyl-8-ribityllumazine synthase
VSGAGSPDDKPVDCHDLRVAVVAARWHGQVMDGLLAGARRALDDYHVEQPGIVRVPGSFELPVVAGALAQRGYEAIVALGVVIRGGTPHFEYISGQAAAGVLRAGLDTNIPVIFGILTTDTAEQALDRAGLKSGNKGFDAAVAAIEMANLYRTLRAD